MVRTLVVLSLMSVVGCAARAPRFPGPLGPVGGEGSDPSPHGEVTAIVLAPSSGDPPGLPHEPSGAPGGTAQRVADAAVHYLSRRPRGVPDDCVGFVWAAHDRVGIDLDGNSADLWDRAKELGVSHKRKQPRVGDVAFFDDTWDRNRNGRLDDPLTHVAIVLDVEPDGTIHLAHGGTSRGRTTMVMNLRSPALRRDEAGKELNSWLRRKRDGDPRGTRYLSGELWRGFATFARVPQTSG